MKTVAIIGAGPAGLSAAYYLLCQSNEFAVTIFEKDSVVGGLSKTYVFDGGRVDIGGHRFFSQSTDVINLWQSILPNNENGMLLRDRNSHILWNTKLIEYPIQLNFQTLKALGMAEALKVVGSYLKSKFARYDIDNLEDFYIDRFGAELYSIFFKDYTAKLWGISADKLSPNWGAQRVQKVSLWTLFLSMIFEKRNNERSLIDKYHYPAFGSGQLWDELSHRIVTLGGTVEHNCLVKRLELTDSHITTVEYVKNNIHHKAHFDYVISSMPLSELITAIDEAPANIKGISSRLHYRDMIIVAISISKESMGTCFLAAKKDSWIYIQDANVPFGRIQILNNWSPFMVRKQGDILLELEYFCNKDDDLWKTSDEQFVEESLEALIGCGICNPHTTINSFFVKRIEKAYPVYADGYNDLGIVENWIEKIDNLRCIGRNGQHRYNNMDHAVETGLHAARSLIDETFDRALIWNVNRGNE